ncbi:MAG: leucine-rich repeat domain-containing protein [Bacteroidetes bacterium]|nr:leucine-rich repeat domain-containing protein [Bacteroidota bacterium]
MKRILLIFFLLSHAASAQENDLPLISDTAYIYRSLSAALANPGSVYKLNLSKTKLKVFPPGIFKLTNLRELDLSKNKLDSLPKEIGTLTSLMRLNLSNNNLAQLPDEIGRLASLTYLGLNRNVIESLPATIGDLENLEVLELWDNELSTVPEEITKCKKLKVLELRGILFSDDEHMRLDTLMPDVKVYLSPGCNCKF